MNATQARPNDRGIEAINMISRHLAHEVMIAYHQDHHQAEKSCADFMNQNAEKNGRDVTVGTAANDRRNVAVIAFRKTLGFEAVTSPADILKARLGRTLSEDQKIAIEFVRDISATLAASPEEVIFASKDFDARIDAITRSPMKGSASNGFAQDVMMDVARAWAKDRTTRAISVIKAIQPKTLLDAFQKSQIERFAAFHELREKARPNDARYVATLQSELRRAGFNVSNEDDSGFRFAVSEDVMALRRNRPSIISKPLMRIGFVGGECKISSTLIAASVRERLAKAVANAEAALEAVNGKASGRDLEVTFGTPVTGDSRQVPENARETAVMTDLVAAADACSSQLSDVKYSSGLANVLSNLTGGEVIVSHKVKPGANHVILTCKAPGDEPRTDEIRFSFIRGDEPSVSVSEEISRGPIFRALPDIVRAMNDPDSYADLLAQSQAYADFGTVSKGVVATATGAEAPRSSNVSEIFSRIRNRIFLKAARPQNDRDNEGPGF